jgi:hypothetical protein
MLSTASDRLQSSKSVGLAEVSPVGRALRKATLVPRSITKNRFT